MSDPTAPIIFDPRLVRARRERAAARLDAHDFLFRELAERLSDRLLDIRRSFPLALDIGCHGGEFGRIVGARGGIERLVQCDPAPAMARRAGGLSLAAEADALPFPGSTFDLAVSVFSLHWVNDLPGALAQVRRILKPDGLFIAALAGGGTLSELRAALIESELAVSGGASPRVAPFADLRDAGALLQRAGFALPVADSDTITVRYEDMFRLLADLRGMGETAAMADIPRGFARREIFLQAAEIYRARHKGADGRIPATFEIVWLAGWAPDPSQQRPARRGSAKAALSDFLSENGGDEGS